MGCKYLWQSCLPAGKSRRCGNCGDCGKSGRLTMTGYRPTTGVLFTRSLFYMPKRADNPSLRDFGSKVERKEKKLISPTVLWMRMLIAATASPRTSGSQDYPVHSTAAIPVDPNSRACFLPLTDNTLKHLKDRQDAILLCNLFEGLSLLSTTENAVLLLLSSCPVPRGFIHSANPRVIGSQFRGGSLPYQAG